MLKSLIFLLCIRQLILDNLSRQLYKLVLTSVKKRIKLYCNFAINKDKNTSINIFLTFDLDENWFERNWK